MKRSFSTVAIQLLLWAIYYSIYLRLSRLKFRLLLYAVIKFRAKLKAAQLANFSFMSLHIIVCRDISTLWEDKLSSGCDIRHLMTLLSCRDLITLLQELLLSRPKFLSRHKFLSRPKFLLRPHSCSSFSTD